jgi:uncharacterized protein (TIGR02246 family)
MHPPILLGLTLAVAMAVQPLRGELAPAAVPPAESAAIEAAVRDTNAQMTAAADRLDADAFFSNILDDAKGVIVQNGSIFTTRQEALEAVKRGFKGVTKSERKLENVQVTVLAPDLALLVADGTNDATLASGRSISLRFAVSLLFARREGKWKLLHGHYSMPMDRG